MKFIDLTGQRFGRLTVLSRTENKGREVMWLCRCDCGTILAVSGASLRKNNTRSCGCLQRDTVRSMKLRTTHGMSKTRLYRIWHGMKDRCFNIHSKDYSDYGGRGITVCAAWSNSFEAFRDWALTNGYRADLSIDRIEVNGNYEPSNCRWATLVEQGNNRRYNNLLTYNGRTQSLARWSAELGINEGTLWSRLSQGWTIEKALTTPVRRKGGA